MSPTTSCTTAARRSWSGWGCGRCWPHARRLINSAANPKLAVFFVSLFPQFVTPDHPVLPAALLMSTAIVTFDLVWYGTVAFVVDRLRRTVAPRLTRVLQRLTGAVLIAFGLRLATENR
jgi:threonine/homoserine/homoserine lactone efflux protein